VVRTIDEILQELPFSSRYSDRQEEVLAVYLYEKISSTRKDAYEEAGISETAANDIDDVVDELKPREKTKLMGYLDTRYEELAEEEVIEQD